MLPVLYVLMGIAMLAVLGTLMAGVFSMSGGEDQEKSLRSNKLMMARVVSQGFAVFIFILIMIFSQQA